MAPQRQVTRAGVRAFLSALAETLTSFQQTPLDDREPNWVLRHLKAQLEATLFQQDLCERDRVSLVMMFQRLEWYCILMDMKVEYNDDHY